MKAFRTKKQFVNFFPKSKEARYVFSNIMDSLHAMEVKEFSENELLLMSINQKYRVRVPIEGNKHWRITE